MVYSIQCMFSSDFFIYGILAANSLQGMKIAVKLETATYAPTLKLACLSSALTYHVLYTIYFVSHHVIAYTHVYYSLMFNNVFAHAHVYYSPMFIVLSVEVVLLLTLK